MLCPRTLVASLILSASLSALASPAGRFAKAPGADSDAMQNFTPAVPPLGLSSRAITVVVELSGDPVTVTSAATPMTKADRDQLKKQIKAAQAPVEQALRDRGATVLASYQSSYNGVKVRIAADKVRDLAAVSGVVAVHTLQTFKPDNTHGVPLVGGPAAWGGSPGFRGENIKIAIIDTGIDYTHADFGGPGTAAAYTAAHANETAAADPRLFGPNAAKVKGGIDLVGDSYNADPNDPNYQPVPHPDANPLDCNGHGSHVAGTAAGFGVLANGTTYAGPYEATTISAQSWTVGPGVAPKADLYAVRVFGCAGSTDVTVDAIEWAVDNDMDVINMSLGSPFGSADDPSAVASTNAAKSGVIVVASAGNSGTNPYLVGSPSTGTGALSVAANDPTPSFPSAAVAFSTGTTLTAINANGAVLPAGALPVKVLKTSTGAISLGCNPAEYTNAGVVGKIVVTARGTCARVARAVFGQKAGAAAVIMLNNATSFPPFEGKITGNPDTGEQYDVTIPLLGIPLSTANRNALLAADGGTATLAGGTIVNPGFTALASFTSGGPRSGDSGLKPEVTAPGVSIFSVGMGTGNQAANLSGTSMAAPHTTGVAALTRQAHPDWKKVQYWKAAIVNTASPAGVANYSVRNAGAGLVQAQLSTRTQVVALAEKDTPVLNFGFVELDKDFRGKGHVKLRNFGNTTATFTVGTALGSGSAHSVSFNASQITVKAGEQADVEVTLSVAAETAGDSSSFGDVAGVVTFTPASGSNNGVVLRVPYYLVPQGLSDIKTKLAGDPSSAGGATATVTNKNGVIAGAADWYAWGLEDKKDKGLASDDLRAVGAQTFPADGLLAFAISTKHRWSNAGALEFDISVDVDGDGKADYLVVGTDLGALQTGSSNGQVAVAVFPLKTGSGSIRFLADAPTDSSTIVLPVLFSQLCTTGNPCLSATNPRLTYSVQSFGLADGTSDTIAGSASFNAFTPSISNGMFDVVAPGASATETVAVDLAEWARTPALGAMVVSHDNRAGDGEAQLIKVDVK